MTTSAKMAARTRAEILEDMAAGIVPRSVQSFSEMHDDIDADGYGGSAALLDELRLTPPPTDEPPA